MSDTWKPGERNLITDVPGLLVGNACDKHIKSGVTVLSADRAFTASVDVMGGAPGSRETELLYPDKLVDRVDAIVLAGGSAFGLDAASGVVEALRARQRGFAVGPLCVPIVPAAIIFDLINGGDKQWNTNPYAALGQQAYANLASVFELGTIGAGTGATTASLKGGLGSASLVLPDGYTVGALVVANPHGHSTVKGGKHFWAAPFEMDNEFGGHGVAPVHNPYSIATNDKFAAYERLLAADSRAGPEPEGMNTTIAVVATSAPLSKSQLQRLAVSAQDGMARAIVPSHTPLDGDLIFSVSLCDQHEEQKPCDPLLIGHAAAICLSRAIARGVYHAQAEQGDTMPSWRSLYAI